MLLAVVVTWGIDPVVNTYLYNYYSAAVLTVLCTFSSWIMFIILSAKKLRGINADLFKTVLPISIFNSAACLLQRIGLQYTTPASYAFLEHISCVTVPIVMILFFRKRSGPLQWLASLICLVGCFILAMGSSGGFAIGVGEVLCTLAGVVVSYSIVMTGNCSKKIDIYLFMTVHMGVYCLSSLGLAVALNYITVGGTPIERAVITWDPRLILFCALFGLFSVGACWLFRNEATRYTSPSFVAIISPFSAIVTGVASLLLGYDKMSPTLAISAVMILAAVMLSGVADARSKTDLPKIKEDKSEKDVN